MRTAGQGQAAAPWERDGPPKVQGLAWAPILGRGRISPGLSRIVERYQFTALSLGGGSKSIAGASMGSARSLCGQAADQLVK